MKLKLKENKKIKMENYIKKVSSLSENLKTRKLKKKSHLSTIKNYMKFYCDNTTMHGVKYLTIPKLHWSER